MKTLRIGRPPRLPRRQRIARVLKQLGRYALSWIAVGAACFWIADVRLFVPGLAIAAMVANPWRPKKSRRQFVDAAPAVGRGLVAGATSLPALLPPRRAGTPPVRPTAA